MTAKTRLTAAAREQLQVAGISQAAWARQFFRDGRWHGDACGCPDDRCIGHHHDEHDTCECLPALLAEHTLRPEPLDDEVDAQPHMCSYCLGRAEP